MAKITPRKDKEVISVRTRKFEDKISAGAWWNAATKKELADMMLGTATLLKTQSQYRYRQAAIYARLYSNMPLFGFIGSSLSRINTTSSLPVDRPTMNVVSSCVDTLVSRLGQSKPRPLFLTDNGDSSQRALAKQMNGFIQGEFYRNKAYKLGENIIRDSAVLGTGAIKVFRKDDLVNFERKINTEILVDPNESLYGDPRQMYELKLVDRSVLADLFPKYRSAIAKAEQAYPDTSGETTKTVSDQVMVVEGWHLPSGKDASDGMHVIACSEGIIFEEVYEKQYFPFAFLNYSDHLVGFWGQGLAERLMGTQVEINKLLMTISASINLVGVPRVFLEEGSKVVKAQLNNNIGSIVTFRGTKPIYEVAPCVPAELYGQLQRLVDYAYQQSGISSLSATSQKPAGLNSGAALREYDDLQSDRFATLQKRYEDMFIDLAYKTIDMAKDIAKDTGSYSTVFPNKDGTREIDFPKVDKLKDTYVIQCYDVSSLPKDPAGRKQEVIDMMQAGLISPQEGRRLLDFPDIEQVEKLANAGEERIMKILDDIVDHGQYSPPDPFMDLELANRLVNQYYNLYEPNKLGEKRAQMLRDFSSQVMALKSQAAMAMMPQGAPGVGPQAVPTQAPVSDMIPNVQNPMQGA